MEWACLAENLTISKNFLMPLPFFTGSGSKKFLKDSKDRSMRKYHAVSSLK
jgi:hypothetical protein